MQRVKNIDYEPDDLYAEEEDEEESQDYTEEDTANFATLTPVVRAELEEAGLQASDREIQDALWHYYWDVGKSVAYLKNSRTPRPQQQQGGQGGKKEKVKEKAKTKFDEAAERSREIAVQSPSWSRDDSDWFKGVSWSYIPPEMRGELVPTYPAAPRPKLLGGSSKLAKLAEERRKKAAASLSTPTAPNGALSSLDRLSKSKDVKENVTPSAKPEVRKYPVRQKREPTPPPKEPSPEPDEPDEDLPDLRASPTAFGKILSTSPPYAGRGGEMVLKSLVNSSTVDDPFKGPSPDDNVLRSASKSKQSADKLSKKTEALKLDSPQPPSSPTPQLPKIKSKGLNVPKLWAESRTKRKPFAAFIVIGHVDHGKSTLMGRLLLDTGAVAQRDIDKYRKEASEQNKASFALAWVLDTTADERSRGITVDVAQHPFHTSTADFTILDAPGHRDFVPAMLAGASMADLAVLVVDANQLESGMSALGQTREHVLLAWASGITRVIVAVNKLDVAVPTPWNEAAFQAVKTEVGALLTTAGFTDDNVSFIPCSGLSGLNVATPPPAKGATTWVSKTAPTLLAALERAAAAPTRSPAAQEHLVKSPLRMRISDVFRGSITNPLSVSGRLASGTVQLGDVVLVQPSGERAGIRGIETSSSEGEGGIEWAAAGDLCTLHLADIDAVHLRPGDVVCAVDKPVPVVKRFVADVSAVQSLLPQGVDVHKGRLHVAGRISALLAIISEDGEGEEDELGLEAVEMGGRKAPRVVKAGERAEVEVVLDEGAAVAVGVRVVLRCAGSTVAAGKVVRVVRS